MYQRIVLAGNVGKTPEIKDLANGKMAHFTLATTQKWTKDGEANSKTTWHSIAVFGKQAEIVEKYVDKGKALLVEGEIDNFKYELDGETRYGSKIIARNIQFLPGGAKKEETKQVKNYADDIPGVDTSDEIPF